MFNYAKLDKKLNKKRQQEQKQQEQDRMTLKIYDEVAPNQKLQKQLDKIMSNYQDHYNINRLYQIHTPQKYNSNKQAKINLKLKSSSKSKKNQNQHQNQNQNQKVRPPYLDNVLKLIKTNPYIQSKQHQINYRQENPQISTNQSPTKKLFLSSNKMNMFQVLQVQIQEDQEAKIQLKQKKISQKQHKRQLKYKFRKNIKSIIKKLKVMKMTVNDIFQYQIFDPQPYKFGKQIFSAVKQGDQSKVFRIFMQKKFSLFSKDSSNKTPLMWACIRGYDKLVLFLLENGVDQYHRDYNKRMALSYAIQYNHLTCVKYLMLISQKLEFFQIQWEKHSIDVKPSKDINKSIHVILGIFKFMKGFNFKKRLQYFHEQYKYYYQQ